MGTPPFRVLLLGSIVLAFGCSSEAPQAVEKVGTVEEKSIPQAPVTEDDFKILDVVLLDLLNFKDFDPSGLKKIVMDPMTAGDFDEADDDQFQSEVKADKDKADAAELGAELKRRNPKPLISLAGYSSPSPDIIVKEFLPRRRLSSASAEENSEEKTEDPRFRIAEKITGARWVIGWLPGYSKDGNTAVFRAHFGPSAHGEAILTYKLTRKDGKWTVVWRKVVQNL